MSTDARTPLRHRAAAPGELSPLDDGTTPERRALATALRELFSMLQISLGELATKSHRDKGAVSRYLSGKRIPQPDFIEYLLTEVAQMPGRLPAALAARIREVYLQALEAHDPKAAKTYVLEEDLRRRTAHKADLENEVRSEVLRRQRDVQQRRALGRPSAWAAESATPAVVEDLQRQLQQAINEKYATEKQLILERARASAKRKAQEDDPSAGYLGCIIG